METLNQMEPTRQFVGIMNVKTKKIYLAPSTLLGNPGPDREAALPSGMKYRLEPTGQERAEPVGDLVTVEINRENKELTGHAAMVHLVGGKEKHFVGFSGIKRSDGTFKLKYASRTLNPEQAPFLVKHHFRNPGETGRDYMLSEKYQKIIVGQIEESGYKVHDSSKPTTYPNNNTYTKESADKEAIDTPVQNDVATRDLDRIPDAGPSLAAAHEVQRLPGKAPAASTATGRLLGSNQETIEDSADAAVCAPIADNVPNNQDQEASGGASNLALGEQNSVEASASSRLGRMQRKSGLKLIIPPPVKQTAEPPGIPASVVRAMERVLPESSSDVMKELDEHLRRSVNYIDQQLQPDAEILKYDQLAIAHIIPIENSRKANLNLTLCNSVSDVISLLEAEQAPFHKRFIFRDENIGQHYSFADISVQPGAPASIILLESADLKNDKTRELYETFARKARMSPALADLRMGIIDVNVQRSPADCLIFCLSFALKSDKHADLFTKWHDSQHSGLPFSYPEYGVKAGTFSEMGFNLYPSSLLPADFIKHTHSREMIGNRLDSLHANDVATRDMLTKKSIAKEPRLTEEGTLDYLPSIEYKRRDFIARALNVIATSDMQSAEDNSPASGEQNGVKALSSQNAAREISHGTIAKQLREAPLPDVLQTLSELSRQDIRAQNEVLSQPGVLPGFATVIRQVLMMVCKKE